MFCLALEICFIIMGGIIRIDNFTALTSLVIVMYVLKLENNLDHSWEEKKKRETEGEAEKGVQIRVVREGLL